MNGENLVEIETTEMRKMWRKRRKRNWRIGKENAGSEMEEKQRRGITSSNKRNSGVTGGGCGQGAECPPETSDREISPDLPGKKRQGKMERGWKLRRKEGKLSKGRCKIENGRWKSYKMRGLFCFYFCFVLLCLFVWWVVCLFVFVLFCLFGFLFLFLFCFFSFFFFAFSRREKSGKNDFAPSEKLSCYDPEEKSFMFIQSTRF